MKILYVDSNGTEDKIQHIKRLLSNSGHEVETVTESENTRTISEEKYSYKLNNYDVLIEHLGTLKIDDVLKQNPHLRLIKVTNESEDTTLNEADLKVLRQKDIDPKRLLIAKYTSNKIMDYINRK